jgi:cell division protease FtsH
MAYDKKEVKKNDGDKGPPQTPKPGAGGGMFMWILIIAIIILGISALTHHAKNARRKEIPLSELYSLIQSKTLKIENLKIADGEVTGKYKQVSKDGPDSFMVRMLPQEVDNLCEALRLHNAANDTNIKFELEPPSEWALFLLNILPILLIVFFLWFFLARQFRSAGGTGGVLSFGKARARLHTKEKTGITFDQVAGIEEAKEEVQELVEFLKNPAKFRRLGGRIPRGTLLVGAPGCGKTLLAKAIAGEAEVPFFSISGSDFIEMFVGVGASRVRDLFRQAKENAPCIIFLDEIDAVGRRRGVDLHGASAEGAQTLNAILVEMDGFGTDDAIIVIGATNRPDVLDPALARPGRFDRTIVVNLPDMRGREAILRVHARKYKLASNVDLCTLARGTPSFSGAELEALLNEAALIATRADKTGIEMVDLEEARDKVRWGKQRRSMRLTEKDRTITAYHESGHALAAKLISDAEPLHKVSIIPQGMALGMTMSLPEQDKYHVMRKQLKAEICVMLAGRVAEEMFCEDITSGAQNDLDRATDLARNMVCRWGMSERIGPVSFHDLKDPSFMSGSPLRNRACSESTSVMIDEEIARIITEAYESVQQLLAERRGELQKIAEALLKYEVLYAGDVDDILAGKEVVKETNDPVEDAEDEVPPITEENEDSEDSDSGDTDDDADTKRDESDSL